MAVTYAIFRHGHPLMVDYTPGAATSAGDLVITNDSIRIAHHDIPANVLGALAVAGGIYDFPKATSGGSAIADDKTVYWDNTAKVITTTVGSNKRLGRTVGASVDADATQRVFHSPG